MRTIMLAVIPVIGGAVSILPLVLNWFRRECPHARSGYHCYDTSCWNSAHACVRCNTPEDAPWYHELECT